MGKAFTNLVVDLDHDLHIAKAMPRNDQARKKPDDPGEDRPARASLDFCRQVSGSIPFSRIAGLDSHCSILLIGANQLHRLSFGSDTRSNAHLTVLRKHLENGDFRSEE